MLLSFAKMLKHFSFIKVKYNAGYLWLHSSIAGKIRKATELLLPLKASLECTGSALSSLYKLFILLRNISI